MKALFSYLFLIATCSFQIVWAQETDLLAAKVYFSNGNASLFEEKYQEAQEFFRKSSKIFAKIPRWNDYIQTQQKLIFIENKQENFLKAILLGNSAIRVIQNRQIEDNLITADLYSTLAFAYLNLGQNIEALEYAQKAVSIAQNQKAFKQRKTAEFYNTLGLVYFNTGNNNRALENFFQALEIRQEIYGIYHPEVAGSYLNLGLAYSAENPDKAQEYYEKARDIYEDNYGANHPQVALTDTNMGIVYLQQKKYFFAIQLFEDVLSIWKEIYQTNSHPKIAFIYSNMGQVYLAQKKYMQALDYQERALEIYKTYYGDTHPEIANIYNAIGAIHLAAESFDLALENYQKALMANVYEFTEEDFYQNPSLKIENIYNTDILLATLVLKAQALETKHFGLTLKLTDLEKSLETLELCDSLITTIRQSRTRNSDKIALGKKAAEVYEDAVRVCWDLSQATLQTKYYREKAFEFSEKSKSAILLSAISDTQAKQYANIPNSVLEEEKKLKAMIGYYENLLAQKPTEEEVTTLRKDLYDLNQEYEAFISTLENNYPQYFNLKYNNQIASVTDLQNGLSSENAIISYFVAEKSKLLYIFYVTKTQFKMYNEAQIPLLSQFLVGLRNAVNGKRINSFLTLSPVLYKQLFPFKISNKIQKLTIIPDGQLSTLSFEVLLTKNTKREVGYENFPYLIKEKAICYDFSATLFLQNTLLKQTEVPKTDNIFVCAPIEFQYEKFSLNSLPGTEAEANQIQTIFNNSNLEVTSLLYQDANETQLKSDGLMQYKYLHFATHGTVNSMQPELSRLFLYPNKEENNDGSLYSGEIYNLELDADLVTLSACQTGLGKIVRGEGLIGLTRALVYAGANNIIVSLWSVSDNSTAQMMVNLYQYIIQEQQDYPTALRQAKLDLIQSGNYAAPYYWAPFVLIGR